MPTEAQRRANQKQDATRKRVAIFLDLDTARLLDAQRGQIPRVQFVRQLLTRNNK